ncbi:hypothetical protein LJ754_02780 [Arthrobacter sp. zg-Y40]|uniref:hypothetical protein n=1 Tax=unclassified Arthrobacter TaxID=235627 RepID=UPI001D152B62|nr:MULTISPECIES: hypothetical protein [unclassified Arthrobacter]MCC3278084.1 hypothetical protein [Arthrobacter sp. zg-Y40]MDK1326819.1 hypothetical protein [Arthrobacter sp. zg-Y1143]
MTSETKGGRTRLLTICAAAASGAAAGALLGWAAALRTGGDPALYVPVFAAAVGPVAAAAFWMLVLNAGETRRLDTASAADVERSWTRDAAAAAFTDLIVLLAAGVVVQAVAGWAAPLPLYCAAGLGAWTLRYAVARHRNS